MKNIFLILLLLVSIQITKAQLKLEITDLDLYNIELGPRPKVFSDDGKYELLTTRSHESTYRNSPYIEVVFRIINESDSILKLHHPAYCDLIVKYRFKDQYYAVKFFSWSRGTSFPIKWDGDYRLVQPNEYLEFGSRGFLIPQYSELAKETKDVKDFSSFMIKILPTLRFQYRTDEGLVLNQDSILNVTIKELQPAQYMP